MQRRRPSSVTLPRASRPQPADAARRIAWASLLAMASLGLTVAQAQTTRAEPAKAPASTAAKAASVTKPLWSELTAAQKQALQPLEPHWNILNVGQKRKWLVLSRNYGSMKPEDQAILRSRMTEWAALSNQQRAQARLNFAEVKRVPADQRKAKWEQYQALSAEEKRKLAERAPVKPRGAAIPVRPVSAQKLVAVPAAAAPPGQHVPRIQLAPPAVPVPAAAPAASVPASTPLEHASTVEALTSAPPRGNFTPQPVPAEAQVPPPHSSSADTTTSVSSTPSSTSAGHAAEQSSSAP